MRMIFRRYAELGSVRILKAELDQAGVVSKNRSDRFGRSYGAKPQSRGALYHMLANRLYLGEITHKGMSYPGEHLAIVGPELWDEVQNKLADNRVERAVGTNAVEPSLLAGLITDAEGDQLTPTHAVKHNTRYRYYVSQRLLREGAKAAGRRVPAAAIENLVIEAIADLLAKPAFLAETNLAAADLHGATAAAKAQAAVLKELSTPERRRVLLAITHGIVLHPEHIAISLDRDRLLKCLQAGEAPEVRPHTDGPMIELNVPATLKRVGVEMKFVVPGAVGNNTPDPSLVRLLARAHTLRDRLLAGGNVAISELARAEQLSKSYVTRFLRLTFLAPDMVTAILDGRQPVELTASKLMADTRLPIAWAEQRARLGFA